jgi:type I restriction-modification system DNA methylase subunit
LTDINSFREILQNLISKFEKDKNHYLSKGYPEAQVRIDFLNPFFEALGWDMENKAHKSPHERDVIVELSPETTGRPDYNFRINGATKFFVEAKAPSIALDDVTHILQAKTYAWSTKEVYFAILTDFEEFKLFDASLKPNPKFPGEGLVLNLKYTDYPYNLEKLWELSKERVEQGSLEALLPKDTKSKRLRIPPDKSFLEDLTEWRTELAKDIHKRNPEFDVKLLNDVVQKLLDRIIFIRIAEDRRIRPDRELWEIIAQWKEEGKRKSIMSHLAELFREVNDDLNGDIFKPHACETADVDSALLADIIENLYFPKSRYRFEAIGVELLGSIYERYLGSTIRVTPQRVKVEEKPEVRKAGGVYYTPKYIVDYIVKNTVGKLIEGKTPRQIEKIRILDPACGSGSFLLGAYQYLIDYHLRYYREHPKEAQTLHLFPYWKISPEELSLPIREKAKILSNNIFGVDIDPQAVEITMMSLYLKALEGERGLLPRKQHLLPSLGDNIKCGNSLIGYDMFDNAPQPTLNLRGVNNPLNPPYLKGEEGIPPLKVRGGEGGVKLSADTKALDDDTKSRINPFDWDSKSGGFGEIIASGGFDAVIGNPPYVRIQTLERAQVDYFNKKYQSAGGNYDIYALFVEKALQLLKDSGIHGFIMPHKFFQASYGEGLRKLISESKALVEIVNFRDNQVFEGASTYTCLLFLSKSKSQKFKYAEILTFTNPVEQLNGLFTKDALATDAVKAEYIAKKQATSAPWNFHFESSGSLIEKIRLNTTTLEELTTRIFQGLKTSADKIYIMDVVRRNKNLITVHSKELDKNFELETEPLKPLIKGGQMRRYLIEETQKVVLFPYEDGKLITKTDFLEKYPLCWAYLTENKKYLENREDGKMKGENWYAYGRNQAIEVISMKKIITPDIAPSASYCFDEEGGYYFSGGAAGGYGLLAKDGVNPKYLLAILNSSLMDWYHHQVSTTFRGGYFSYESRFIKHLPIRTIDFNNPPKKAVHDKLVSLVGLMLDLHKKKSALPPSSGREKIEREIAVTDEKIDEIVYGLYGVTDEERKIIEGKE